MNGDIFRLGQKRRKGTLLENRNDEVCPYLPFCQRFMTLFSIIVLVAGINHEQGCGIQIFAIYLLIELANSQNETVFIGFVDYEKAFDFTNRAEIVRDLVENKAGATFTNAISQMYSRNYYVPKFSTHKLGEPISAKHGVIQGRKSSTILFSSLHHVYQQLYLSMQLADDASIISNSYNDLAIAFKQLIEVSESKGMVINVEKIFYIHASKNPTQTPLLISEK